MSKQIHQIYVLSKDLQEVIEATEINYRNEFSRLHREDGPAIEISTGYKAWYINGKRHREDGPAREFDDGEKEFFLDNKEYSEKEYYRVVKILFLI